MYINPKTQERISINCNDESSEKITGTSRPDDIARSLGIFEILTGMELFSTLLMVQKAGTMAEKTSLLGRVSLCPH